MEDEKLNIIITYKKIKSLRMRVKKGQIYVSSPYKVSKEYIKRFVAANYDYVQRQLKKEKESEVHFHQQVMILNRFYEILPTALKNKYTDHFVFLNVADDSEAIKKQIKVLFKNDLHKIMVEKTKYWFLVMNFTTSFPTIVIKDVKSKWGSYNRVKHEIIYSSNLLFKDEKVYDYLIIHELAHIIQFNHSPKFHAIVKKYCPNYQDLRKKLKG